MASSRSLTFWWAWPDVEEEGGGFHRTKSLGRLAWPPSSCSWSWQLLRCSTAVSSAPPSSWLCPWRRSFPLQRRWDCCSSGRQQTTSCRLEGRSLTRWQACPSGCCCSSQTGRTRRLLCLGGKSSSVGPTSSPSPEIQLKWVIAVDSIDGVRRSNFLKLFFF